MFFVTFDTVKLMIYTLETVHKFIKVSGDPRYNADDLFLNLGNGFYTRKTLTRGELYKAMGYNSFDFAYPEPWGDSTNGQIFFARWADLVKEEDPETGETRVRTWRRGDQRPAIVWSYDPSDDPDQSEIFGYPVSDKEVIQNLGRAVKAKAMAGAIDSIDPSFLDKKEIDADLYFPLEGEIHGV